MNERMTSIAMKLYPKLQEIPIPSKTPSLNEIPLPSYIHGLSKNFNLVNISNSGNIPSPSKILGHCESAPGTRQYYCQAPGPCPDRKSDCG